ncbi:MAG: CinA family protein [Christensenellaceae bacterium]|jgi:nicotinamide-nucleotide amidase|nr:CinA family protein [Christensenellaceae bacterium]
MDLVIRVCAAESDIKEKIAECFPDCAYELAGIDWDYRLTFVNVNEDLADEIICALNEIMYGDGENALAETLVKTSEELGIRLAVAESCTGGMIASAITDIAGASLVFYEGIVSYSNNSKFDRLGVSEETVARKGAVSEDTAIEMAAGLIGPMVDIGISSTGIAGPGGGSEAKPVGMVCIAVVSANHTDVYRNVFIGDRFTVRNKAKNCALFYALKHIAKYY